MNNQHSRFPTGANPWKVLGLQSSAVADAVRFDCELEIERRIEAFAFQDSQFWRSYSLLLEPEFFSNEAARGVMALAVEYAEQYGAMPDHPILRNLIKTKGAVVDQQAMLDHADQVFQTPLVSRAYAETVLVDMARKLAMRAAVIKISQINETTPDTELAVDSVAEVMTAALSLAAQDGLRVVDMRREAHLVGQWLQRYQAQAIPTLLPTLDDALHGGLLPGELGIILAPPHRGKSLTMVNLAAAGLLAAKSVLVISNEDGIEGLGPRLYARITGMPTQRMAQDPGKAIRSLNTILGMLHGELLTVYMRPRRAGVREIEALLERLNAERGFRPDMVILDYADRLKPPRRRKDQWDELLDIYMELSGLAKEKSFALWTASQTNRAGFSKELIDMSDFAGAFSKAAEADVVVAVCQTPDEHKKNEMRLLLAKARNRGHGRVVYCYVNYPCSMLSEVPAANIPQLVCNQKKTPKKKPGSPGAKTSMALGGSAAQPMLLTAAQQQALQPLVAPRMAGGMLATTPNEVED